MERAIRENRQKLSPSLSPSLQHSLMVSSVLKNIFSSQAIFFPYEFSFSIPAASSHYYQKLLNTTKEANLQFLFLDYMSRFSSTCIDFWY